MSGELEGEGEVATEERFGEDKSAEFTDERRLGEGVERRGILGEAERVPPSREDVMAGREGTGERIPGFVVGTSAGTPDWA
jgi:hypothetical protein